MTASEFRKNIEPILGKLYRLAKFVLRDEEKAKDAVQEALAKLWARNAESGETKNFKALAYVAVRNVCIDVLRKKGEDAIEYDDEIFVSDENPQKSMEKKELKLALDKAIAKLSEKYKTAIILREIEGAEYGEISKILGVSPGACRIIVSRARKKLKETILANKELYYE